MLATSLDCARLVVAQRPSAMAAVAAPAEPAPGGAPGAPALLSVRALPENATQAERNKAKKTWPPVENGGRFVLFVDDLRLDEYTTPRCDVRMVVHHDGMTVHFRATSSRTARTRPLGRPPTRVPRQALPNICALIISRSWSGPRSWTPTRRRNARRT